MLNNYPKYYVRFLLLLLLLPFFLGMINLSLALDILYLIDFLLLVDHIAPWLARMIQSLATRLMCF